MYSKTKTETVVRLQLAISFAVIGVLVLALLGFTSAFPSPVWLWAAFAAAFVFFSWQAVEVNDKLLASPTTMVLIAAGVAFGREAALFGMALIAAVGPLSLDDVKGRRWFQPLANFGQMVVSATAAGGVLVLLMPATVERFSLLRLAAAAGVAAVVHGMVNFSLVLFAVRRVFGPTGVRPWSNLLSLVLPMLGMGFLGGLLGAAYQLVGSVALPLTFVVFFVGHMTFSSYSQLREAQESTLRGFIKALEAKDLYTRGHTERVAHFAELIGEEMGFNGTRLERLRWAALIHDVGKLAVPRELIRKRARLSPEEYSQMQEHVHLVQDLLSEVEFLHPMVDIAANHHAHFDGNGYHGNASERGNSPAIESCILAVADSFDAMTSTRSYRIALSQDYAFMELRRNSGTQFDPEVVDALVEALRSRGETYGSPDVHSEDEARRRAEGIRADG